MSAIDGAITPAPAYTPGVPQGVPQTNGVVAGTYPSYGSRPMTMTSTSSVRIAPPVASQASIYRPASATTSRVSTVIPLSGSTTPGMRVMQAPVVSRVPSTTVVGTATPPMVVTPAAPPPPTSHSMPVLPPTAPPLKLTEGLPNLDAISSQREAYMRSLDEQEKAAQAALDAQRNEQIASIRAHGERKKAAFNLEVDQQVQRHDLALSQQHGEHMMVLNQQYSTQRGALEQQANSLVMEFQLKKAHEDMLMGQYQLQREMHDSQKRYEEEMGRIKVQNPPTFSVQSMQAIQAPAVPTAYHPVQSVGSAYAPVASRMTYAAAPVMAVS